MGLGASAVCNLLGLVSGTVNQGRGYLAMERTVRPSQREVPVMHSAGQDAERLGLRHMVDWVGQTVQLADARSLECRERGFLDRTDRTSAEVLKLAAGMELDASSMGSHTHHERHRAEGDSSKDHTLRTGADRQQECG